MSPISQGNPANLPRWCRLLQSWPPQLARRTKNGQRFSLSLWSFDRKGLKYMSSIIHHGKNIHLSRRILEKLSNPAFIVNFSKRCSVSSYLPPSATPRHGVPTAAWSTSATAAWAACSCDTDGKGLLSYSWHKQERKKRNVEVKLTTVFMPCSFRSQANHLKSWNTLWPQGLFQTCALVFAVVADASHIPWQQANLGVTRWPKTALQVGRPQVQVSRVLLCLYHSLPDGTCA